MCIRDRTEDPEAIEAARKLFAGPIAFLKSAPSLKFLPGMDAPEVAFAGRSNVGKSSLLNALTGRNALARTSVSYTHLDVYKRQSPHWGAMERSREAGFRPGDSPVAIPGAAPATIRFHEPAVSMILGEDT